jgi:hypothetical protein
MATEYGHRVSTNRIGGRAVNVRVGRELTGLRVISTARLLENMLLRLLYMLPLGVLAGLVPHSPSGHVLMTLPDSERRPAPPFQTGKLKTRLNIKPRSAPMRHTAQEIIKRLEHATKEY